MDSAVTSHDFSSAPINKVLSAEDKLRFLREMLRIRRFEQAAIRISSGENWRVSPSLHWAGVCRGRNLSLMGANDHVITAYRDHGHAIAVDMSMNECMAEFLAKPPAARKGRAARCTSLPRTKTIGAGMASSLARRPLDWALPMRLSIKVWRARHSAFSATAR